MHLALQTVPIIELITKPLFQDMQYNNYNQLYGMFSNMVTV